MSYAALGGSEQPVPRDAHQNTRGSCQGPSSSFNKAPVAPAAERAIC